MTDARRWITLAVFLATPGALAQAVDDASAPTDAAPADAAPSVVVPADAAPSVVVPNDPVREAARLHFQRGVGYIEQERWADAILELQRARDLRVTPAVLYNLGLAYRAVGRNRDAMGPSAPSAARPEPRTTPSSRAASTPTSASSRRAWAGWSSRSNPRARACGSTACW
jgi:hypothetical protein